METLVKEARLVNGFLDLWNSIKVDKNLDNNLLICSGKVYTFNLRQYKDQFNRMCEDNGGPITDQAFLDWMNANHLTNKNAETELELYEARMAERQREIDAYNRSFSLIHEHRAEYENACDCLYYGYGFKTWYEGNGAAFDSKDDAKIVWKAAFRKMSEE